MNPLNVTYTVELGLCVSCGICRAACPSDAIELQFFFGQYLPVVSEQCTDCGLCLKVCPGYEVIFKDLYHHEGRVMPGEIFIGHVIDSYVCYSKDSDLRKNAASGGMVTALISGLLRDKHYKGACALIHDKAGKELAAVQYTTNLDEITAACKSKYLPASVEKAALAIDREGGEIIIVSTPCQLHGIKKYCIEQNIDYSKTLFLGLFCEKTLNYNLTTYYQWKYGKNQNLIKFNYRNKEKDGWPGHTKMIFENGKEIFVDRSVRMGLKNYFQLQRCLYCIDKLNQLADISFGDCYIKGEESELGKSNILVRTEKGKEALDAVSESFVLKKIDPLLIAGSQKVIQKQQNLHYCHLVKRNHGHVIYSGIQSNSWQAKDYKIIEKSHRKALTKINMGSSANNFAQIDRVTKREKIFGSSKRFIKLIVQKVGVRL